MNNNLQALEKLKISAKKQSNELESTITEIHEKNSKDLTENLKAIHKQNSENLDKSIQQLSESLIKLHRTKLRKIETMIEDKLERENNYKAILTAIITFIITVALTIGAIMLIANKQHNKDGSTTYYMIKGQ